MQNTTTTTIDDNAQNWKLVENSLVSASAAPTVAASSTATASLNPIASSTLATLSTPTTAAVSYSSSSTTAISQSTNLISSISTASTFSTTIVSTSSLASASGPSSSPGNSTSQPGGQAQNALTVGDKAGVISAVCAITMLVIALFALPASLLRLITCGRYPRRSINNRQMRANVRISLRI
jgi:hypothetical protein